MKNTTGYNQSIGSLLIGNYETNELKENLTRDMLSCDILDMIIKNTLATEEQTLVEVVLIGLMDEHIQKYLQKLNYFNKNLL